MSNVRRYKDSTVGKGSKLWDLLEALDTCKDPKKRKELAKAVDDHDKALNAQFDREFPPEVWDRVTCKGMPFYGPVDPVISTTPLLMFPSSLMYSGALDEDA